ncbi:MAG TPA: MFS transporter, partial [Opitutus sp.]|nr:MFS transporter [Opitutus sp.]
PAALPPRERYAPWRPLAELRDPQTRNVAIVASAVLVSHALTEMLHALFVTETLGLSMTALGWTMTGSLVLGLACAYPIGMLIDRCGARAVLAVGFVLLALVELAFVFWVKDIVTLTACLVGFKIAWVSVHLPVLPLLFHNTPPARRGSIFAAVQMTRAGVTSVATILTGFLATMVSSYRVCYFVAALVGVVGVIWAMRLSRVDRWPTPQPA